MKVTDLARIGATSLDVTRLGFGSAPIGGLYEAVGADTATKAVGAAWATGVRLFDTAPLYGMGNAERRVGAVLQRRARAEFVVATKVGRLLRETDVPDPSQIRDGETSWKGVPALNPVLDFSYDGTLRSLEESLERLGLRCVDILHIHDPDEHFDAAMQGAYRALVRLRDEGVVTAIGAGMNQWQMPLRFAEEGDFDCFLLAGRYSLLDSSALERFLPYCRERGISVIVGGVFNSGILADPNAADPRYDYARAAPDLVERARRIEAVCTAHDVPLKAAAIQFPCGHPAVATVVVGSRSAEEAAENARLFEHAIPADLWLELKAEGLLPEEAPVPTGAS
jgi:D-threo-aldose 1-dehydrogenase